MFATQAAALKEKAIVAGELQAARGDARGQPTVAALDEVGGRWPPAALSSGVMIFDADGALPHRQRGGARARRRRRRPRSARLIAHGVPRDGEAEIDVPIAGGSAATLLVARRPDDRRSGERGRPGHRRDRSATARSKSVCGWRSWPKC